MSLQRARGFVRFAALILSAYFCADIAMAILGGRLNRGATSASTVPPGIAAAPKKLRSNVTYYSSAILEKHLFGEVPPAPAKGEDATSEKLPDTPLEQKVTLVGTAVADTADHSVAVIEDKTTRVQDVYRVRDTVVDEATVSSIEPSCVVLVRAGQKERLCLKLREQGKTTVRASSAPAPASNPALGYMPPSDAIQKLDESTYRVESDEVRKAMENLSALFTQVRAVPNFKDGKTDGFRLFSIKKDSIFDKMGLRNGDVIRKVNEYEVNSPEVALQLFQDLRNARDVSVDVVRNDRAQSLSYQIR